ncbi:hypothetical protein AZA_86747 [Nitrospirillum viridazoti Y2]|nr:hypothetical protein AZA_86747 [Nitrospirillum amazonense Y2]
MAPSACSTLPSARSNLAVRTGRGKASTARPSMTSAPRGAGAWSNMTCTNGWLSRVGARAATSSSGRSWWSSAAATAPATWAIRAEKLARSSRRTRTGRVFTKQPISPSASRCRRPAAGMPTITSSWPPRRASSRA